MAGVPIIIPQSVPECATCCSPPASALAITLVLYGVGVLSSLALLVSLGLARDQPITFGTILRAVLWPVCLGAAWYEYNRARRPIQEERPDDK